MNSRTLPRIRATVSALVLAGAVGVVGFQGRTIFAAGGCTAPSTDYGTVTNTVNITGAGTYRIWTRMSVPDTTNNTYLLDVDSTSCYTVGGSTLPVYSAGATTFFTNNSTNWTSKTTTGTQIDVSLSAGSHTLKLIGNAPGVVVDRIILTQDTACTPTGTGDNCAIPPDTTAPVVSITSPANNASISSSTTVTANATDDVAVSKVEFYVDGALAGTDTTATANNYTYTLDPSGLSVGSHTLYAKAYDTSNNTATSSTITFTHPDTTAPTISAVSAGSISQTSAVITWTTNEAADSQVAYGLTTSYGSTTTLDTTKVTAHSVSVTGLTANTTYHFQVKSKDAAGNLATSADATFTTQAATSDTTAPTVSITAPTANATIAGKSVSLSATASDNVGVVGVQFKVDGNNIGSEDTSSPYGVTWNTTGLTNGTHTLTAVARDAAGNTKTSTSVTVTVNNQTADIDQDGTIGYLDLSILAVNYNKSGSAISNARADINGDGVVNYLDLSILASKYGK